MNIDSSGRLWQWPQDEAVCGQGRHIFPGPFFDLSKVPFEQASEGSFPCRLQVRRTRRIHTVIVPIFFLFVFPLRKSDDLSDNLNIYLQTPVNAAGSGLQTGDRILRSGSPAQSGSFFNSYRLLFTAGRCGCVLRAHGLRRVLASLLIRKGVYHI